MTGRRFKCLAFLLLSFGAAAAQAEELKFLGYVRSLVLQARAPGVPDHTLSLNRLRLQLKGELAPGLATDLQYDNDYAFGHHLDATPLLAAKDAPSHYYWNAQSTYANTPREYGTQRLYRASVTLSVQAIDVRLGRQRIAWGTGRFWSPLDLLNPVSPTALDREERPGVDALLVEAKTGPLSRLSFVHVPNKVDTLTSNAVQWHANARGVDYSLVAGRLLGEDVTGLDLATQIGQAGLRGELTRNRPVTGDGYTRTMLGIDYAFANTLILSIETYYNGGGSRDLAQYRWADAVSGRMMALATRYWGLFLSYELTPLLKLNGSVVFNADDKSRGIDLRLIWSVRPDLDLTLGGRSFSGAAGSEYRRLGNAIYGQAQWYF